MSLSLNSGYEDCVEIHIVIPPLDPPVVPWVIGISLLSTTMKVRMGFSFRGPARLDVFCRVPPSLPALWCVRYMQAKGGDPMWELSRPRGSLFSLAARAAAEIRARADRRQSLR